MATLGIFGGTFDPPHRSHAAACLWALQTGAIDRVLMIPTARHAFGKEPGASFAQRLEMCRLAVEPFAPGLVEVSDIEGRREGVSYMIDTVRALEAERPGDAFRLLVGSDILDDLPKWRESEKLLRLAPVLEIPRIAVESLGPPHGLRPGALPMLSSSTVREMIARGEDVSALVPEKIAKYIIENSLYSETINSSESLKESINSILLEGDVLIEFDEWRFILRAFDQIQDINNDNLDVIALHKNKESYATIYTLNNIQNLMNKFQLEGPCLNGSYFWCPDELILKDLKLETIESVLKWISEDGIIKYIFKPYTI